MVLYILHDRFDTDSKGIIVDESILDGGEIQRGELPDKQAGRREIEIQKGRHGESLFAGKV